MNSTPVARRRPRSFWKELSPLHMATGLWKNRELIIQLTWRDIVSRYKGSFLGLLWAFLLPIGTLAVYTFVFGTVMQSRWGTGGPESKVEFALTLFAGLIYFQLFTESTNAACFLIPQNVNYVKKVVFPLEVLPLVTLLSTLVRTLISILILLIGLAVFKRSIPPTAILAPIIFVPLMMLTLGLGWFLCSLGVFIRDIGQFIGIILNVLFFLTPIFYPSSRLPPSFQWIARANPLASIVEDARRVLIQNSAPDWHQWLIVTLCSAVIMQLGYAWFMATKKGFADVL